ncbi:MAG: hypothetical protein IT210_17195 [Armatimonadetes bacterium]|nr:hypothetical protein [Armatimonadota bacterium]
MQPPPENLLDEYIRYFTTVDQYEAARLQIELWHFAGLKDEAAAGRFVAFWFDRVEAEATRLVAQGRSDEPSSIRKVLESDPQTLRALREELCLILPLMDNPKLQDMAKELY